MGSICQTRCPLWDRKSINRRAGAPAVPMVQPGEHVDFGQLIATPPAGKMGARYHASIAGVVEEAGEYITIRAEEG